MSEKKAASILYWKNPEAEEYMIAAFDKLGQQIPELQGSIPAMSFRDFLIANAERLEPDIRIELLQRGY